jgi:hypothetical protein
VGALGSGCFREVPCGNGVPEPPPLGLSLDTINVCARCGVNDDVWTRSRQEHCDN